MSSRDFVRKLLESCTDKNDVTKDENLSLTYAGRQMGHCWVHGFNPTNMRWLNRLFESLAKYDPSVRKREPGIQELLDRCKDEGLCSEKLYKDLRRYCDMDNDLPVFLIFE